MDPKVTRGPAQRRFVLVAALAAVVMFVGGCGPDSSSNAGSGPAGTSAAPAVPPASISFAPADGTDKYRLDSSVKITAAAGTLTSVVVTRDDDTELKGAFVKGKTAWKNTGVLSADTEYTIKASAVSADGKATESTSTFTTLKPAKTADAWIQPSDGNTVGVGMPVIFNLSNSVDQDRRAKVEEGLIVDSKPAVEGAFRWFSDRQVQWRPKSYWPSGTKVHAESKLSGIQLDKGVWGDRKADTVDFTVGSSMISTVDVPGHKMTVRKDGKIIKTIPVTTGRADMATRNGIKVIMSRETTHQMNAETIGIDKDDPDYYNLKVKYAMRLTYSGEFIHAAPWSVGSQGSANVSHGCTGMSTANARWMFDHSKMGDVVVYKGSKRPLEWGNGYTAWDMSYSKWKA